MARASDLLGDLLAEQEDWSGAEAAYQAAIDTADPQWAPIAQVDLALLRWQRSDTGLAQALLEAAAASGNPQAAALARAYLGGLLMDAGEPEQARELLEAAAASGVPQAVALASAVLGDLLAEQEDWSGAEAAYQAAINTADPQWAPIAQVELASLRQRRGISGVRELLEAAAASGNLQAVARASDLLGDLLAEQEDWSGAEAAYQAAINTADPQWAQIAQVDLALLRWQRSDISGARELLEAAAARQSAVTARAYGVLGDLLAELGRTLESQAAYEAVINTGNQEASQVAVGRLDRSRQSEPAAGSLTTTANQHEPAEAIVAARRDWALKTRS